MNTVGVWAGPSRVDGVQVVGDSVVWAACEGLVTTPILSTHRSTTTTTTTTAGAGQGVVVDEGENEMDGWHPSTQYIHTPPFNRLDAFEVSRCGRHLVLAGRVAGGEGMLVRREWPLKTSAPSHVILRGHIVHHMEFNNEGNHLGVLSTTATSSTTIQEERQTQLVLSVWRWPTLSNGSADMSIGGSEGLPAQPQQVVATILDQVKAEQVTRLSLGRGLPSREVTVMLAVGEEVQVWRLQEGPLGPQLISTTIGFGLLAPDSIFTMWCLTPDAYALGVGSGWVVVGVGGEVVARLGGGAAGPCHSGPLTDLHLHTSHLYTVGGDGWLRVWEAEMVEEAALKTTRGMREVEGWFEAGMKTSWLQLVRELPVHNGPGFPVTLTPAPLSTPVWIVQTTTGVIYGVWAGEWSAHVLHQGPSERVTGVALSPTTSHHHQLLAATTHQHYLLVAALPQANTEESLEQEDSTVQAVTTLAQARVEGIPSCVTWATCQVTRDDDLVVIGLEDGSVNVFLLHLAPKTFEKRLTLIQVERPHECRIQHISTTKETEPRGKGGEGTPPILVTSADDCRLFLFRLTRGAKLTKLEPIGFHQLKCVPQRITVQGAVVLVELLDGLAFEIPAVLSSSGPTTQFPARAAPDSWLLQQHLPAPQMMWEGGKVVHQQVLEEMSHTCCSKDDQHPLLLMLTAPDGLSMIGVTPRGQVVHTHRKADANYSVRVSTKLNNGCSCDPEKMDTCKKTEGAADCKILPMSTVNLCKCRDDKFNGFNGDEKTSIAVVACVADNGAWAAAWVAGGDLFVYRAKGASFPLPQCTERKFRLVSVRGVGSSTVGPSLEQRAQKDAGEKRRTAMENRATLLQQKLSKLKWDFRKVTLRADEVEGGATLLEEIPLHPSISTTLHKHTTDNMNKVVSASSLELERLEVLLGKLRTLYSWNPLVSVPAVQFLSSGKVLTAVDHSEEVFALLSRLAQICQGREVMDGGAAGDMETPQSLVVVKVQSLLADWLKQIRAGRSGDAGRGGGSSLTSAVSGEGAAGEQGDATYLTPRPAHPLARKAASSEGDTSDEGEEHHSLAALEAQVREVVDRVGSAGHPGGSDHVAEGAIDPGRQLQWRRTALNRLKQHRAGEASRSCQLAAFKKDHAIPQEDNKKEGEEAAEGEKSENEKDAGLEEEVVVPPPSATVEEVETHLWALLGKVEEETQKTREVVKKAALAQEKLLETVNQYQKEWGHSPLTLLHMPHHLHTQVTDDLVNEFYCDLLDLEESGEVGSVEESRRRDTGGRGSSQRASVSPRRQGGSDGGGGRWSPPITAKDKHRRHDGRKEGEGTAAVPPLSLKGSPRQGRIKGRTSKTTTTRAPRTSRVTTTRSRTTSTPSARSPTTKAQRSGRGRRSVRDSTPRPPPAPRPQLTLEQVQQIQRSRTYHLTTLSQVPEPIQQEAQEVEAMLEKCQSEVVEEQGRLAWAVLRVGQLVRAMSIMVKYRNTEKRLRHALRERIKEQQAIKEKVLGLRQRIAEYEDELQCLSGLEEEVDRAFTHLATDNAQFEVQLTRYYESRAAPGMPHHRPQSASSSSSSSNSERGEDEGQGGDGSDSGDSDSGLGTDEARTDGTGGGGGGGGAAGGLRPPGCDPAVFSLVTVLRELRWRISTAAERGRREKAVEERRHAAIMRRLHRAAYASHTALSTLNSLQSEREEQLGAIPCVVWLRQSQTAGDLTHLTRLPVPNTDLDSMMAVKWYGNGSQNSSTGTPAATDDNMLLTKKYLDHLNERVAQAKIAQELAARRHREGRAERRALTQQVEQLKQELANLRHSYQVTKECKLGSGAEVDLLNVENKLDASLDLRWPSKVASQVARHDSTMMHLQTDTASQTRELRALQKEEAALAAHILALRQERDHLHYHLKQTISQKRSVSKSVRGVGKAEEVRQLRATVARQDETIAALRLEINSLRDKTGTVTLPGLPPLPKPSPSPSPPAHSTSSWTEEQQSTKTTDRDSLPQTFRQDEYSGRDSSDGTAPGVAGSSDDNADISSSSDS
ncbi:uncharacterized protein LOC135100657 isoform X2 [Scylla paramamosain]|uniref:uncharacterized protein LOC135100657 isoform X2 n=1 Tax=Scylla paramamosain TaxID=85552 RepID=UPI003083D979